MSRRVPVSPLCFPLCLLAPWYSIKVNYMNDKIFSSSGCYRKHSEFMKSLLNSYIHFWARHSVQNAQELHLKNIAETLGLLSVKNDGFTHKMPPCVQFAFIVDSFRPLLRLYALTGNRASQCPRWRSSWPLKSQQICVIPSGLANMSSYVQCPLLLPVPTWKRLSAHWDFIFYLKQT